MDATNTNRLDWLIPTGHHDIAVQKLLKPIFGDAIACKIPGDAACGNMSPSDPGALIASLMQVFNGTTWIFATILMLSIGLMAFIKTANDGEFLGKSWNTTFTALRLVAGIGFLLPMPNGYSSIQNVVLYVGLWSAGAANEVTNVTSEHYLRRLQVNMTAQIDPTVSSVRSEAAGLLAQHTCAAFVNGRYGVQGAALRPQWSNLGGAQRVEFAWVETGNYLQRGSAPCGRLVIEPLAKVTVEAKSGVPAGAWNSAFFADPLTTEARKLMTDTASDAARVARVAKIDALRELTAELGPLVALGSTVADRYALSLPTYNEDGGIARGAVLPEPFNEEFARLVLERYTAAVRKANAKLVEQLDAMRTTILERAKNNEDGSFFAVAKTMLQAGGWMAAATTHRSMLDMVSTQFIGAQQKPPRIEPSELLVAQSGAGMGPGGLASHIRTLDRTLDWFMSSDTGRTLLAANLGAPEAAYGATPAVNRAAIEQIVKDPSPSSAFELLYGGSFLESYRGKLLKTMAISQEYDPLYQVKSIGDMTTALGEYLVVGRMAWAASLSAVDVGAAAATGNVVGQATGANSVVEALLRGAERVMATPLAVASWFAGALAGIGYLFSTWLPALPVVAMLVAQVGWLLGLIMTMFAVNIWAVMHLTPANSDSFVGSQAQGYLLMAGLFFRPLIAVSALAISFMIAPPLMSLLNATLLPAMFAGNVSTNTLSVFTGTIFGLVLYFFMAKALLVMVYMLPQTFPDEVLRFLGAGSGDLGQAKGLEIAESTEKVSGTALGALQGGANQLESTIARRRRERAEQDKAPPALLS